MPRGLGIVFGLQWRRHAALVELTFCGGKQKINRTVLGSGKCQDENRAM